MLRNNVLVFLILMINLTNHSLSICQLMKSQNLNPPTPGTLFIISLTLLALVLISPVTVLTVLRCFVTYIYIYKKFSSCTESQTLFTVSALAFSASTLGTIASSSSNSFLKLTN